MLLRSNILLLAILISVAGCYSKNSLKKILAENPDILTEAIEKNPQAIQQALQKANQTVRQLAQTKAKENEKTRMEEEFKNPKNPEISSDRAIRGNKKAPITIVTYSDFECPFCQKGFNSLEEVRKRHKDQVRVLFKHFPLPFHSMAMPAAKRFEAIALQNPEKAYAFHDEVFSHQDLLNKEKEAYLDKAAAKVGANISRMKKDMELPALQNRIQKDMQEAKAFGVQGTPAFYINGVGIFGAKNPADFEAVIQRHLHQNDNREVSSENQTEN